MLQSMRSAAKYIWILLIIFFVGGFLLVESSGLMERGTVTTSTAVATVNGQDILATDWYRSIQQLEQQETQQSGRTVTLDQREQLADQAFEQLVSEALLRQEYERRGIRVTDDEITQAAKFNPPPQLMQSPELQTDGQFDRAKYQRFLTSPVAKQDGLLLQLESYYRSAIPKEKLFEQVAADVYVTDARLWSMWHDTHDSAQVSFVGFNPSSVADALVQVTDREISAYYSAHKKELERAGRAQVSVLVIPRSVTPADSAAVRARLLALRTRIAAGEKFEDVARAESQDTASATVGGSLGRGARGRFVAEFETAAFALATGQLSPPVLTQFGYHLMRVDERKGDTLALRHILLRLQQSDSAASRTDRRADSLARIAASTEDGRKFDEAARTLGLTPIRGTVIEGQALTIDSRFIPSVSAWAFKGVRKGETSDLFDSEDGYFLARLDSVVPGGVPTLQQANDEVRAILVRDKKLDLLAGKATQLARAAAASSLENAAKAMGLSVSRTGMFTRVTGAPGLGRLNEAVGAAFSLPVGQVSSPIRTQTDVLVERVDNRVLADRKAWEAQRQVQRGQTLQQLRQQKVRDFISNLRESAKVTDRRKEIDAATRQATP